MRFTEQEEQALFEKLERELGPVVRSALSDANVLEISLNHDGIIRIEHRNRGWTKTGEYFSPARALTLLNTIATMQGLSLTRTQPILQSWLPGYGARIQGVTEPVVQSTVFSIRKPSPHAFRLDDYVASARISVSVEVALRKALSQRESVLVVGGTGSGKTTLVNALLLELSLVEPDCRVVVLEDTRELICQPEWVQFEAAVSNVTLDTLLRNALRFRPDRIVVGEVRGAEAITLLRAWNTGHPGGISTIHANSTLGGLLRLEQLVSANTASPRAEIVEAVRNVVFIERGSDGPKVTSALRVQGLGANGGYDVEEVR